MTGTQPQHHYKKAFLDAIDTALVAAAQNGIPYIILYRRSDKLDVRVKIDCVPPVTETPVVVIPEV